MFRPAKLYHATILLDERKVDALISNLHEIGVCELKETDASLPKLPIEDAKAIEEAKALEEVRSKLKFILDALEPYKPVPQPENLVKALFNPKEPFKHEVYKLSNKELLEEAKYHLELIQPKITERLDNLKKIEEKLQQNNFLISNLYLIPDVKTTLFKSTANIKVFLGIISTSSFKKIKEALEKCLLGIKEKNKTQSLIAVLCPEEEKNNVERTLHQFGFEVLSIPYEDITSAKIIKRLKSDNNKLEEELKKIKTSLKKTQKIYEKKLGVLNEELELYKEQLDALKKFKTTKTFSVIEAWIPAKNVEKFNKVMKESSSNYYFEIKERNDAPTLFNNPKFVSHFETITELYSVPKYNCLDPTPVVAFSFALFFGFMLTDFVYGLLIAILAYGMVFGAGKYNPSIKKFGKILMFFSFFTIILGALFGSYCGNFFQQLGIKIPTLVNPMNQVMLTLYITLTIGALHLLVGLFLGFYENFYQKKPKEAFASQGVWILFLLGIFLIIIKLNTPGLAAIGVAVLMQIVFNFLSGGPVHALLSIFGFSGFIGDLFSYARLMALAIGTSGIALAVNFMTFLVIKLIPWLGIPIAIIIFIVGHLFNTTMNGLGSFIHSTRLHFLEFFSKFYDGGGRVYKPFHAQRKVTTLAR